MQVRSAQRNAQAGFGVGAEESHDGEDGKATIPGRQCQSGLMLERAILLAPDAVARRAARYAKDAEEAWMLRQPRATRASFCREAHGRGDNAEQAWMLRQPDAVRESYISEVLEAPG